MSTSTRSPIYRLLIFTKGGLLGIIDFSKDKVEFQLEWPEDVSISGMALVATLINVIQRHNSNVICFEDIMKYAAPEAKVLFGEKGARVLKKPLWLAYVPENSDYILVAEYYRREDRDKVVEFLEALSAHIRDVPEESIMVCTEALKCAWELLGLF
mgnify:CR=1 FL=1